MLVDALLAVANDLLCLRRLETEVADDDVGRAGAILRRLLIEDSYGLAWRAVGMLGEPSLVAVHLPYLIPGFPSRDIVLALAGGAPFRGVGGEAMCLHRGKVDLNVHRPALRPNGYPGEKRYTVRAFLASASGVTQGDVFTRRDVIRYVARMHGGVRQCAQAEDAEQKLVARVASAERRLIAAGSHGLGAEIVAMGRALVDSEDAQTYIDRAAASTER